MKHLLILLFTLCAATCSIGVQAKENKDLAKADYYYNHFDFHEAIPFYEKIADQVNDPAVYTRLGDCYKQTGSLDKAAALYDKAVKTKGCDPAVMLRYGQMLMQLGKYDEAERWLKGYQKNNKGDKRVANLIAGCSYAQKAQKDIPSGIVTFENFNTDGAEFGPTIWNGRLVFTSDTVIDLKKKTDNWTGHAYYNIYSVSCDNKGVCGTDVRVVTDAKKLNIKYHNGPATFSADGKQMYYTRTKVKDNFLSQKSITSKDSIVLLEIMIASGYDDSTKEFNKITPFQYNNKSYTVAHPTVSPNGKMLVFSSTMPKGVGGSDLYLCKLTGDAWSAPQNAGAMINTEGEEVFPYWADDNTLYFSSDGHEGFGGLDIYKTSWNEKSNTFSRPENMGAPVNSSYDDISLAMYADGRSTYLSSNRPAVKAGDNIYFYKREKLFLQLNVKDSTTQQGIAGAKISLGATKDKQDKQSDNTGSVITQLYPGEEYSINISKDGFEPRTIMVNASISKEVDTIVSNVALLNLHPKKDTIPPQPVVIRHESVMDTPGIQQFELNKIYEVGHFYYDYDKYELTSAHKRFLDTMLTQMHRHPTMRIEIHSHTDCRGSDDYNQVLSKKRALSVVNFLVAHGISRKRLEYIGYGSTMPKVKCPTDCNSCTEEQHYLNRILEFKVLQL